MNPETVSAAEFYFCSDDDWLRFKDKEQEKRRRKEGVGGGGGRGGGEGEEEGEQSDANHPTHSELHQEKSRLKRQRLYFKGMVFKGDFFSMDSDENLLNLFLLLLMTSHLPLVNMTASIYTRCLYPLQCIAVAVFTETSSFISI